MVCAKQPDNFGKNLSTQQKKSFGFQVSPADPCMIFNHNKLGIRIIIIYVDDMLIIRGK